MAFSQKTLDFLMENRINDSKLWFNEHRADYNELVRDPMRRFVEALVPVFGSIDPMIVCDPVRSVSRIFRDARYSKTIFRETLWCSFSRDKHNPGLIPGYFFEITPAGFSYGCGCYNACTDYMSTMRRLILADSPLFGDAREALAASDFLMADTRYKRTRHPDAPEWQREWLDQRSPCILRESGDLGVLFSEELPETLGAEFLAVKPYYDFLLFVSHSVE